MGYLIAKKKNFGKINFFKSEKLIVFFVDNNKW